MKKFILSFLISVSVLIFISCDKNVSIDTKIYMPLTPQYTNAYIYKFESNSSNNTDPTMNMVQTIKELPNENGYAKIYLQSSVYSNGESKGNAPAEIKVGVKNNGDIWYIRTDLDDIKENSSFMLKNDAKINESWEWEDYNGKNKSTFLGFETVTTDAGAFKDCIKIKTEVAKDGKTNTYYKYYAPQIGYVKAYQEGNYSAELVKHVKSDEYEKSLATAAPTPAQQTTPKGLETRLTLKTEELQSNNLTSDFFIHALTDKGEKRWTQKWSNIQLTELPVASNYIINDDVIIIEVDGNLYGLDFFSGKILWQVKGVGSCSHTPVVDPEDGTIYVSGYYGPFITAVKPDGSLKWRVNSPSTDIYWPKGIELKDGQIIVKAEQANCVYDKQGNIKKIELINNDSAQPAGFEPLHPATPSESNFNGVIVKIIDATSFLTEGKIVHSPANVCDGNKATAWVENAAGDGIGESLQFYFDDLDSEVASISLINGYAKSSTTYYSNNRVKKIRLIFSDNSTMDFNLKDDIMEYQTLVFDKRVKTGSIEVTILEVYKGTKYKDTCISEFKIN